MNVIICGDIAQEPTITKNNHLLLKVVTHTNEEWGCRDPKLSTLITDYRFCRRYEFHKVFISNPAILQRYSIEEGQRVFVSGFLEPRKIPYLNANNEQKMMTLSTFITPKKFCLIRQDAATASNSGRFHLPWSGQFSIGKNDRMILFGNRSQTSTK